MFSLSDQEQGKVVCYNFYSHCNGNSSHCNMANKRNKIHIDYLCGKSQGITDTHTPLLELICEISKVEC